MLFTSRINEAEFRIGPEMSSERGKELERVERVLAGILILEFNADAALRYAIVKATMFKRGRPIGDCDALIASVALAHGQLLLTRNPRHFRNIPGLHVQSY
jgi:tRNA(fMet)-specific endonuclease VapC